MDEWEQRLREGTTLAVGAHPDDLTLAAGGALQRARAPYTVVVTDGAPRHQPKWRAVAAQRRAEELAAMGALGVAAERITLLDLPDQQTHRHLRALVDRLRERLRHLRPDLLLLHAYEQGHPDHDATAFAVHRAALEEAREGGFDGRLLAYPLYHRHHGKVVLRRFRAPAPGDHQLTLDDRERSTKARALAAYHGQRSTLAPFPIDREPFRPIRIDGERWHAPGESVYRPIAAIRVDQRAVRRAIAHYPKSDPE